jgi:hypothetical protein
MKYVGERQIHKGRNSCTDFFLTKEEVEAKDQSDGGLYHILLSKSSQESFNDEDRFLAAREVFRRLNCPQYHNGWISGIKLWWQQTYEAAMKLLLPKYLELEEFLGQKMNQYLQIHFSGDRKAFGIWLGLREDSPFLEGDLDWVMKHQRPKEALALVGIAKEYRMNPDNFITACS